MPNPLARTVRAYAADARAAFTAAPTEVALGVLLAASLSVQLRADGFTEDHWLRLAAAVSVAFPLVFTLSVLRVRGAIGAAARWAGTVLVLVLCAWYGAAWADPELEAEGWRWFSLFGAALLALTLAPAVPWRDAERRRTWAFDYRLVVRLAGVSLYAAALYAILAGAFAAVVTLFDLDRPEHLFADLAGAVFFAVAPWIFVGGIHRLTAPVDARVPDGVSRLGRWLYAPVLVIYLLILYAYAVKVVATGELPKNLVSPLVLAAALIGLVGAVLLEPVHGDDEHRGVSVVVRLLPVLLLPLVTLAIWALGMRVAEYGWTPFRWVRALVLSAVAVLAVMGTVRRIRGRAPLLASVPALLAIALLLAAVGPWSASAVSRRDQAARLRAAVRQAGIDPARVPYRTAVTVDSALYERVSSGAHYLLDTHGVDALRDVFPNIPDTLRAVWRMGDGLGIRPACRGDVGRIVTRLAWDDGVRGMRGGTVREVAVADRTWRRMRIRDDSVRVGVTSDTVLVEGVGWTARGDLSALSAPIRSRAADECAPPYRRPVDAYLPAAEALVLLRDGDGRVRAQLLVTMLIVGGPLPRQPNPQPPGLRVREVQGLLVLPE